MAAVPATDGVCALAAGASGIDERAEPDDAEQSACQTERETIEHGDAASLIDRSGPRRPRSTTSKR